MSEKSMELKDFVKSTLEQIVNGIADANFKNNDLVDYFHPPAKIDFELSVIVSEINAKNGELGVSIPVLKTGGKMENKVEFQNLHKINFSVEIKDSLKRKESEKESVEFEQASNNYCNSLNSQNYNNY